MPLRDHLEKAAYHPFAPDADAAARLANAIECPPEGVTVWAWFMELHKRRNFTEIGPVRFSWIDIQAWLNITGTRISGFELDALLRLEDVYFNVYLENKPK